jgi:hypothetical protein
MIAPKPGKKLKLEMKNNNPAIKKIRKNHKATAALRIKKYGVIKPIIILT